MIYKYISLSSGYSGVLYGLDDVKDFIINQLEMIREQTPSDEESEDIKELNKYIKEVQEIESIEQTTEFNELIQYEITLCLPTTNQLKKLHDEFLKYGHDINFNNDIVYVFDTIEQVAEFYEIDVFTLEYEEIETKLELENCYYSNEQSLYFAKN
ncbi:hypothetical protein HB162lentus_01480 [Mammaliicoccus lentus]